MQRVMANILRRASGVGLAFTLAITLAGGLSAQGKGGGKGNSNGKGNGNRQQQVVVYAAPGNYAYQMPQTDLVVLRDYYSGTSLPPGLAKKLARGGSLPPGWQKKIRPVPVVLQSRLAPLPRGYQRGIYDGVYVVYQPNRGLVIDIFASFGF